MAVIFGNATTYAIRAVLYLAIYSTKENKVGIKEIAEKLDLPYHFLGKILQQLSRQQVISSIKGPGGGFYLSEDEKQKPMIQIIDMFEGAELFQRCGLGLKECSEEKPCPIHNQYKFFREQLHHSMANQTIEEWATKVLEGNVAIRL